MDLNIFRKRDPSGRMSKESYVFNNFEEEYKYIINYCNDNNIDSIPFKEKVYLCINDLKNIPTCNNINCTNVVKYKNSTIGYLSYCSNVCISSDINIKKRKEEKSIERYGTKTPSQSDVIKSKIINTNNIKYGGNSPMSCNNIIDKSKKTLYKNYNVSNPSYSKDIQQKRIESFKESSFRETFKNTSLERYGETHHWKNKDIHKKTIDSFYFDYRKRIESKTDSNFKFIDFNKGMSTTLSFHCVKCDLTFNILPYQFYYRNKSNLNICTNCFPISENSSISQIELYNFIIENYNGEVIENYKNAINPYEIDIYIPDLNIGFEFNGVWWHSDKYKSDNYHLKKYEVSVQNNIQLISIWEDDWITKRDICKSFILNKLLLSINNFFARKCIIKEIDYNTSRKFLNDNHLQGDCKSSIRIALYYDNNILSLMTFSKLRMPLNRKSENRVDNVYELTRFCNRINARVSGGASKLLKYFIEKYMPTKIETYSDNLISDGNLYEKIGFEYLHTSKPGYWYVIDGIRSHRYNWRKQKLISMGCDSNKSESEIMAELGYNKIFNAGNKKWVFIP